MSLIKNFRMLARYNLRVNSQLMQVSIALPQAQLTTDTRSFFSNIVDYWNHLLFGDLILLRRLAANNLGMLSQQSFVGLPLAKSPADVYATDIHELKELRRKVDLLLLKFCDNLNDDEVENMITYTTTEGEIISKLAADIIQHLFNHQTHHRGQLTCVLSQFGVDYGCMDLPVIVAEGSQRF